MSLIAKYHGRCTKCEGAIFPGQQIAYDPDSWGQYRHIDCDGDDQPKPSLVGGQCPKCHLTMPLSGVCDCEDW